MTQQYAKILGTGSYLPANKVTNADITALLAKDGIETSDEWIFSRSGIRKDKRYKEEVLKQIQKLEGDFTQHALFLKRMMSEKIIGLLHGHKPSQKDASEFITNGVFDSVKISNHDLDVITTLRPSDKKIAEEEKLIGIELDPTQREAVKVALTNQVCVITGGPGAGKTTITKVILNILSKHLNHFKGGRKTPAAAIISLAAPTGKASKRATESTGFPGSTVHRLLEVGPNGQFKKNAYTPLESEVCSFDEFSMMDVFLTKSTFSAIDRKTRLIIIGDHNQLSSVGPGKVLGDIIDSGVVPTVKLTKIFRQALTSKIITNAYLINEGKMPDASNQAGSDFFFLNFNWMAEKEEMSKDQIKFIQESNVAERLRMQKELIRLIKGLEKKGFDPIRDIQVLAPTRVGLLGTEKINSLLQEALNPNPKKELVKNQTKWRTGDKVMQIRNNYDYNVFNGEVGYIQEISDKEIVVEYDDKTVIYKHSDLDELVLAYAYTIHKSQGSEYPVLIMLFDMSHFMMLKRNVLYTGVTRAKKKCYILGPEQALKIAVNTFQPENRFTCLKKWLQEGIPPEYNPQDYPWLCRELN